jgi:hypothetical protein
MEFIQIISEKLETVIKKHDLRIVDKQSNYLKLQSNYLIVIIVHNQFENSNILWLGRNDEKNDKVEIDNEALKLFFNSDLKLSQVSVETFINNLVLFFENEAQPLLIGDTSRINELEKFDLDRSHKYTQALLERQDLVAANKAWENGNYKEFIKIIDQTNKDNLPSSYQLKYKIANQKV